MSGLPRRALVGLALALVVTGCGGGKRAATKENFENALNDYFSKNTYASCVLPEMSFPEEHYPENMAPRDLITLNELQKLGYVSILEHTHFLTGPSYIFELTEDGRKQMEAGGFCLGTYRLGQVKSFTAPVDLPTGKTVTAEIGVKTELSDWAKRPEVQKGLTFARAATGERSGEAILRLMDTGWQVTDMSLPDAVRR